MSQFSNSQIRFKLKKEKNCIVCTKSGSESHFRQLRHPQYFRSVSYTRIFQFYEQRLFVNPLTLSRKAFKAPKR